MIHMVMRESPPQPDAWFLASDEWVQGETVRYVHETFRVRSATGRTLQLRLSFDENRLLLRSAHTVRFDTDMDGSIRQMLTPIPDIRLSMVGAEEVTTR